MHPHENDLNDVGQSDSLPAVEPFYQTLKKQGLILTKSRPTILQVNTGFLCNQVCRHCHLDAGPHRKELMGRETMEQVFAIAAHPQFDTIDVTGGAPELHPDLLWFLAQLRPLAPKVILRSNLTVLAEKGTPMMTQLKELGITIVASMPSLNEAQADTLRGQGVFSNSIETLRQLNRMGYGQAESDLELDLVANPAGAFLPPSQCELEQRFKKRLQQKWRIKFNNLYSFANVPLGRFQVWLRRSGNYTDYMQKLANAFNPASVEGLMCRTILSVAWDGFLYDCDFNQAAGIHMGKRKTHITELELPLKPEHKIATGDHCYTCTAGAGFT